MDRRDPPSDSDETLPAGGEARPSAPPDRQFDGLILEEQLGSGGQGIVYAGRQEGTGRRVAVKMLRAGTIATEEQRSRFQREIELAASLDHENVVRILGSGWLEGDAPYLVMELVEGLPLLEHALRGESSIPQRLELFLATCAAVGHAHQRGVLHRDLKASNVLVEASGRVKLLDFGTARALDGERLTATREFVGTLQDAAPEQLLGDAAVDTRVDVHALGLLLYQLLAGRHPYAGSASVGETTQRILRGDPRPPSHWIPDLAPDLDAIALKALETEPKLRYQTVEALIADLRRFLDGFPVEAQGRSTGYVVRKLIRRHPRRVAAAAVMAALVAGLAAVAFGQALLARAAAAQALSEAAAATLATERAEVEAGHARDTAEFVVGFFERAAVDDEAEPMAARGKGVIYERTADGRALRGTPSPQRREQLLERWYRPHHARLEDCTRAALAAHGRALIIDGHSFPDTPLPCDLDPMGDRPDICLGTDAFHTPEALTDALRETCAALGWSVGVNRPYAGTIVPTAWLGQDARVSSVMIEVNRRLYMEGGSSRRSKRFNEVQLGVQQLLATAAKADTGENGCRSS